LAQSGILDVDLVHQYLQQGGPRRHEASARLLTLAGAEVWARTFS